MNEDEGSKSLGNQSQGHPCVLLIATVYCKDSGFEYLALRVRFRSCRAELSDTRASIVDSVYAYQHDYMVNVR